MFAGELVCRRCYTTQHFTLSIFHSYADHEMQELRLGQTSLIY